MPIGGAAINITPLKAPFLETFESRYDRLGAPLLDAGGAQTTYDDGKVVVTIGAAAVQGGEFNNINAGWYSMCKLVGDFDVHGDYQLLEWPAANGVSVQVNAVYPDGPLAEREGQVWGEQYTAWISPVVTSLQTLDASGSLRVQRAGATAVSSYLSGAAWVPIASGPTRPDPSGINLEAMSFGNRFAHREVKIAWDNLSINSGALSCPEASWVDDTADWRAAPR
jgi:hypothetical protein